MIIHLEIFNETDGSHDGLLLKGVIRRMESSNKAEQSEVIQKGYQPDMLVRFSSDMTISTINEKLALALGYTKDAVQTFVNQNMSVLIPPTEDKTNKHWFKNCSSSNQSFYVKMLMSDRSIIPASIFLSRDATNMFSLYVVDLRKVDALITINDQGKKTNSFAFDGQPLVK